MTQYFAFRLIGVDFSQFVFFCWLLPGAASCLQYVLPANAAAFVCPTLLLCQSPFKSVTLH